MIKIDLDKLSLKEVILLISGCNDIFLFYNHVNGISLNEHKIIQIIIYFEKYKNNKKYYFYNIPFCFFKKFGRNFIDKHCVRNRLCNYYEGYVTYNKCNKCRYGLFCNNFNKKIKEKSIYDLEGFYEKLIRKEYLLNILIEYKKVIISFGYHEDEICFYSTQKYISEFLDGKIEYISIKFLEYLTIYFLVNNNNVSKKIFESLNSVTLVLKDKKIEKKLNNIIKQHGINVNFANGKGTKLHSYLYKKELIKLEYFYSRLKYYGKKDFFDFTNILIFSEDIKKEFKGKVLNGNNIEIKEKVFIIKKASDLSLNNSSVYIGRDILGGMNINNYKCILISSDGLGNKGRLISSLKSIKIPIIYDIEPDLTVFLNNGDEIKINLNNGYINVI